MVLTMKTIYQTRYHALITEMIACRKQAGLTQQQVADILDKPQSYMAKIEGKDRKMDVVEFVEICKAIQQKPDRLISLLESNSPLDA